MKLYNSSKLFLNRQLKQFQYFFYFVVMAYYHKLISNVPNFPQIKLFFRKIIWLIIFRDQLRTNILSIVFSLKIPGNHPLTKLGKKCTKPKACYLP